MNKNNYRTYSLNERYFEEINNKEKAYILGFIYADGCVETNSKYYKYRLRFGQHPQDREILEHIKKCLGYSGPIHYDRSQIDKRSGQVYYHDTLQINSKKLIKDLSTYGVVPRKSLILEAPPINQEFIGSFIRGYFDGDGSVGLYKYSDGYERPSINFAGTFELLSWIKNWAEGGHLYPNGNIYYLYYRSKKSLLPLIELMRESPFRAERKTKKNE